jgi:hypothetical protein
MRAAALFLLEGYSKCSTLDIVNKKNSMYESGSDGRRSTSVAAEAEATLQFFLDPPSDEMYALWPLPAGGFKP